MNKTLIFLGILLCLATGSFSQKIVRSSLSSFGNATSESGVIFRQTVGQSSSTTTVSNDNNSLRQGFQQPIVSGKSNASKTKECTLYLSPNPTTDRVQVRFSEEIGANQISVFDMKGTLHFKVNISTASYEIDVSKLPRGLYLINVISKSGYHCNQKLIVI